MKILGEEITFYENLRFSFKRYYFWWLFLIVTACFDVFTTSAFVSKYGPEAEANILTRVLMVQVDSLAGNIIGKIMQALAVVVFVGLSRRLGNIFLLFVIILNCWAIVINSFALP